MALHCCQVRPGLTPSLPKLILPGIRSIIRPASNKNCPKFKVCTDSHCPKNPVRCGCLLEVGIIKHPDLICEKKPDRIIKPPKPFISMWANPECCGICSDRPFRHDDFYYKISDKTKKDYRRTWAICTDMAPKKRCRFRKPVRILPPKRIKRPFKCETAKVEKGNEAELFNCDEKDESGCPRLVLCECKEARDPPLCKTDFPGPSNCKKACAPYPAFSECEHSRNIAKKTYHCDVFAKIPRCVFLQHQKQLFKKLKIGRKTPKRKTKKTKKSKK